MENNAIQVINEDFKQIKNDSKILKNVILSGEVKINISNDLDKEFQELDSLSDEALDNF